MQQFLTWGDSFSVGHAALDGEHRLIIQAINNICASCDEKGDPQELSLLFNKLKETTGKHFEHENAILRAVVAYTASERRGHVFIGAISQAVITEHIEEHAQAFIILESMIRDALPDTRPNAQPLREILSHWFVNHAVKNDAHLKTLFQVMEKDCPDLLRRLS